MLFFCLEKNCHRVTTCFRCICDQRGIVFPTHPISTHFGSSSLVFVLLALVVIEKLMVRFYRHGFYYFVKEINWHVLNCSNYTLSKRGYCCLKQLWIRGGRKSGIHLTEVSVFTRMAGKNRHFCDLPQQVLSGVVGSVMMKEYYIIFTGTNVF